MLELAKGNLEDEHYKRLQSLGLKSLPLSNLFKKFDWAGIVEILSVVTDETTRDELPLLINGLEEKRKRILEFKENADLVLSQLEDTDRMLRNKEKEVLKIKKGMDEKGKLFKIYPEPFRSFFSEYLGLYEGELVLAKRLNVNWQRDLRKKEIITYDETLYVHFIKDFNAFAESLISRHQLGLEYRWNSEKDIQKVTPWSDVSENGKYKLPSSFNDPLIDAMNHLNQELLEIQEKRLTIKEKLKSMKSKTVHSYMEMTKVANFLSTIDLKRHREIQYKALKWLYQRGFIAVAAFTLPNKKKADIFAYNASQQIIIFEIKVSQEDLDTDTKWIDYFPYCHDFYFLTPPELASSVTEKIKDVDCGQYVDTGSGLKLVKADHRQVTEIDQQDELIFAAGQLLSRKFVYGY